MCLLRHTYLAYIPNVHSLRRSFFVRRITFVVCRPLVYVCTMRLSSDKILSCPYCIRPLSDHDYRPHLTTDCTMRQPAIIEARLERYVGPSSDDDPIDRYHGFITYDRTYYPMDWTEDFQERNTAFYHVAIASPEVRALQKLVGTTPLHRVERVQNKELVLRYQDFRETNADGREALLFHGSSDGLYNIICNQGFDMGHSKNGAFGYGIYFSSTFGYSKGYAKDSRCMLICRAWITKTTVVSENIHVVHDDFAVYPAYLVHY